MLDAKLLREQVRYNCLLAEAHHGGTLSVCGLVLRLRDHYKWEQGLPPWREPEPSDLLDWIETREARWEEIDSEGFTSLRIGSELLDPFQVERINDVLVPEGLVYGAGYVAGLRPSFFLGTLREIQYLDDVRVLMVGKELARDIFASPAMRQGSIIYARHHPMVSFLWEQIFERRPSARNALHFALAQYGLDMEAVSADPNGHADRLYAISEEQLATWVHHELGEMRQSLFDNAMWREIVASYANSAVEVYARVLKDLAADTDETGLLAHITTARKAASLGFYVAFLRPFTKLLFPEILRAFRVFRQSRDWATIAAARDRARQRITRQIEDLVRLHRQGESRGRPWAKRAIEEELIAPLGILKRS
ncbi:hypothetical protein SAMN02746041_02814 [Desulfacinum hydrothermale DSM 13146]|uniref:Uncharacterized protein n=1 Tax=Desulfacinum hydrothermale DSM 13146 TaxID=1121390 RepID=A0A1W1XSW2_9BACT|nr:Sfum_1244 family protein [Desulfacinum hydrothermale]SMC26925.1 hypothetical protein SAMN02746041_02814 [Desulfacinum hydrothermale DSM 13146]